MSARIYGMEIALGKLTRLSRDLTGPELQAVSNAGATVINNDIKERVTGPSPSAEGDAPGLITGTYRRAFQIKPGPILPGRASSDIGNDQPQAMRLEFGFVGTDSAGRNINQGPRPHMRPAADENDAEVQAKAAAAARQIVNKAVL